MSIFTHLAYPELNQHSITLSNFSPVKSEPQESKRISFVCEATSGTDTRCLDACHAYSETFSKPFVFSPNRVSPTFELIWSLGVSPCRSGSSCNARIVFYAYLMGARPHFRLGMRNRSIHTNRIPVVQRAASLRLAYFSLGQSLLGIILTTFTTFPSSVTVSLDELGARCC